MEFYNQTAKGYDELHSQEQLAKLTIIKDNLEIKSNDLLLDVGCGTGISSQFDCNVIGIDLSLPLLKLNKNNKKIQSAAERLPFKDNIFDCVVSVTSIHNFEDIESSLKEIKRVGRNKFVFSILKKTNHFIEIENLIKKYFKIDKVIEEEKDMIFFCKNLF